MGLISLAGMTWEGGGRCGRSVPLLTLSFRKEEAVKNMTMKERGRKRRLGRNLGWLYSRRGQAGSDTTWARSDDATEVVSIVAGDYG